MTLASRRNVLKAGLAGLAGLSLPRLLHARENGSTQAKSVILLWMTGQMIGSTEKDGGQIKERPVSPGDLAATIYRYFGLPLDLTYEDATGRIHNLLPHGGESIRELFAQLNFLTD